MTDVRTRLAAATGALFVLAVLVGNVMVSGGSVEATDSAAALADFQRDQTLVNRAGFALEILGFAAFLVFLGHLYGVLCRAERSAGSAASVALGSGLCFLAVKVGSAAPVMVGHHRGDDLGAELARTLVDLNDAAFVVSGFMFGLFSAAAACSAIAHDALPRWLGWTGLVVGLLAVAAGTSGIVEMASFNPLPFVAALVWTLVVSAVLTTRVRRVAAPTMPVPSPGRVGVEGPV